MRERAQSADFRLWISGRGLGFCFCFVFLGFSVWGFRAQSSEFGFQSSELRVPSFRVISSEVTGGEGRGEGAEICHLKSAAVCKPDSAELRSCRTFQQSPLALLVLPCPRSS